MDSGKYILEDLRNKGLSLIEAWIEDGYREDLHLDFKRKSDARTAALNDDDRRNLSRALSGFANSDSGIIMWGIDAPGSGTNRRAKFPIHGVRNFAEHLDSLVSRCVSPAVDGVENLVIYENESDNVGYVATYIPRSDISPHRAEFQGLKQYYKRYGESFKIAEHYELEYMFGRRLSPNLKVIWGVDAHKENDHEIEAEIRVSLSNQGRALASFPCLRLRYDSTSPYKIDRSFEHNLVHYSPVNKASRQNFDMITARGGVGLVIYPDDYVTFFIFRIRLKQEEVSAVKLPHLVLYFDLFGEHMAAQVGQKFSISGKKIKDRILREFT